MSVPSLRELRERDERLHRRMILKFGHLSSGPFSVRDRDILEARREALQHNNERIWAEQEAENARLRALVATFGQPLRIADRYAAGMRARR
jgi:hypothetical protein